MGRFSIPSERRLFLLWLIVSVILFALYYVWPQPVFVRRFERAYFALYWNRPLIDTSNSEFALGIIAPRYISSLVDTEMWIWIRRNPAEEKVKPAAPEKTAVEPPPATQPGPVVVIGYGVVASGPTPTTGPPILRQPPLPGELAAVAPVVTPTPNTQATATVPPIVAGPMAGSALASPPRLPFSTPRPTATPSSSSVPMPTPQPTVEAQLFVRQGDNRSDLATASQASIVFPPLLERETAARLIWVRLMPVAFIPTAGESDRYLSFADDQVKGYVTYDIYLWNNPQEPANDGQPLPRGAAPRSVINTRQTVMRGLVRLLLLPPWSNGLVLTLGLLCASLLNALSSIIEQWLNERRENHRQQPSPPVSPQDNPSRSGSLVDNHALRLGAQASYWSLAILATVALVVMLTERFVLCGLSSAGWDVQGSCLLYPNAGRLALVAAMTAVVFYVWGYVLRDNTPGSMRARLGCGWRRWQGWIRGLWRNSRLARLWGRWRGWVDRGRARAFRSLNHVLLSLGLILTWPRLKKKMHAWGEEQIKARKHREDAENAEKAKRDQDNETLAATLSRQTRRLRNDMIAARPPFPTDLFRARYDGLRREAAALPAAAWGTRRANRLKQLGGAVERMEQFDRLSARYVTLPCGAGPRAAAETLEAFLGELAPLTDNLSQLSDLEMPTANAAKALAGQARRLCRIMHLLPAANVGDGAALAECLTVLDEYLENNNVKDVLFLVSAQLEERNLRLMAVTEARDIGRARLGNHWRQHVRCAQDRLTAATASEPPCQDTLDELRQETSVWPTALPGWDVRATAADEDIRVSISRLRDKLTSLPNAASSPADEGATK